MNQTLAGFALGVALLVATDVAAQATGSIGGTVVRDTLRNAIPGSEISIPGLNKTARSNLFGDFRIDGVPAGKHAIMIRHVGFEPLIDSVVVTAGQVFEADFILSETPVVLDSQRVVATNVTDEPNLREFEERRKLSTGHFIDKVELRKIEGGRSLINYLAGHIPGLSVYRPDPRGRPLDYYLSSGRGASSWKSVGSGGTCPVSIYMDGVAWSLPGDGNPPLDISNLSADDYSAIEYYASGMTPPEYNKTHSGCGVLLFWRRDKR
jgi:hypothetical protein